MNKSNHCIPAREAIEEKYTWDLTDLFPSDEAWEEEFQLVSQEWTALKGFEGRLGEGPDILLDFLEQRDTLRRRLARLSSYASRKADQDTRVGKYQSMLGRYSALSVGISSGLAFQQPELLAISEDKLRGYCSLQPRLRLYSRQFELLLDRRGHVLTDGEEKLLAAAQEMESVPHQVYSRFINADLTFEPAADSAGGLHPLTNGSLVSLLLSKDRVLRENAYEGYYGQLGRFRNTAAALMDAEARRRQFYAQARHYGSALEAAVHAARVPQEVYLQLLSVVNGNLDLYHRYMALRKRVLGVEPLRMFDAYVSLVPGCEREFSFEEAQETVLRALTPLGEEYCSILRQGYGSRWIDVYENQGKRSGAYSAGGEPHPYILMNYKNNLPGVFTLAHESGHAMHSYLSAQAQPYPYQKYVTFVAEVASTCNEALLIQYLLQHTQSKAERASLVSYFLEKFRGTLFRQTMFAEFELRMGQLCAQGTSFTAVLLCKEYKELNQRYFGPAMDVDDCIAIEWARIPHFYYNYYLYQYATGFSAAIALSRRILREGEPAVQDYLRFLSGGSSQDPIDLLWGAGVDMAGPEPIQSALDLFRDLLEELEQLLSEPESLGQ